MVKKDDNVPIVDDQSSGKPTKVAGYKAKDLMKAPLEPPEPKETEGRKATKSKPSVLLVAGGAVIGFLAVVWFLAAATPLALLLGLLGAALVVIGVFVPFSP